MELDDLPKERLKQLIYEETAEFVAKQQSSSQQQQSDGNNDQVEPMQ